MIPERSLALTLPTPWQPIAGGITAPEGFLAAGSTAGLKASGKSDLSLLLAPVGAVCA
ncbi:MAG: arginine biosynthesis bifunctional protein ArgJ, partial [Prochlorococcaceae cyanobacterium]